MSSNILLKRLADAIEQDSIDTVKALIINEGADPRNGWDPLMHCIQKDRLEIAKFLIRVGANPTKRYYSNCTYLYCAIHRGNLEMVKLLLDNGADFIMYEHLEHAIDSNRPEIVRELIQRGVDVHSSDGRSAFPIMLAIARKNCDIFKLLVESGADVNVIDDKRDTPFFKAIRVMDLPIIEYFINSKVDLNAKSSSEQSELPIMCAITARNTEIVKLFLENGADANIVDSNGDTPLAKCATLGVRNCDIWKLLVGNGANVNFVDRNGDTPLIKSVRAGNVPLTEYLIRNKADLNVKNAKNDTPLSVALEESDFRTFKLLIEAGADPELACEGIEAMTKQKPEFAAYMARVKMAKNIDDPKLKGSADHKAGSE